MNATHTSGWLAIMAWLRTAGPSGRSADGVLYVTGRDVEEAEHAMSFDANSGAWTTLDGPAADYELRDTRADLIRVIREHPGLKPAQLAEVVDANPATVRQTLTRIAGQGQVRKTPGGAHFPARTQ